MFNYCIHQAAYKPECQKFVFSLYGYVVSGSKPPVDIREQHHQIIQPDEGLEYDSSVDRVSIKDQVSCILPTKNYRK